MLRLRYGDHRHHRLCCLFPLRGQHLIDRQHRRRLNRLHLCFHRLHHHHRQRVL
jgi:hypothetical protein